MITIDQDRRAKVWRWPWQVVRLVWIVFEIWLVVEVFVREHWTLGVLLIIYAAGQGVLHAQRAREAAAQQVQLREIVRMTQEALDSVKRLEATWDTNMKTDLAKRVSLLKWQ